MKITKVTIENLNSIRGRYTIDFEKSFSAHGLFLLTGDTGAGKTTILDAISISLYGETPRLKSKSELEQIISLGEKESLAEVEFVVDKELYKSSWSIAIARTGTVKDAKRVLSIYNNSNFEIIPLTKRDFNNKIEEITNLNFDRFTKTVMLAQGSFDGFLQAKDSEKSDLLEKITGTQIYQKISQKVFEREKEEKTKLTLLSDKIDESKILQDEEVEDKTIAISTAKEQSDKLQKEQKELQYIIKIVENISKYKKELESLREDKTNLGIKKDEFKEDDKRLENSLKAKDIYTQIIQENSLTKDLSDKKANIKKLEESRVILSDELKEIEIKLKLSDDELVKFKEIEKLKLKDIDSAKELLINQKNIEKTLGINSQELDKKDENIIKLIQDIDAEHREKSKLEESFKEIEETSSGVENQKKSLIETLAKLEDEVNQIDNIKLIKEKNIFDNRLKDIEEFIQLQGDKSTQDKKLEDAKLKVEPQSKVIDAKTKRVEELSKDIEHLERLKLSALSIQNYEESRKSLKDNEECPLCGSCKHPYLINMPKFDDTISTDLNNSKSSLKTIKAELKKDEAEFHNIKTSIEVAIVKLQTTIDNLAKLNINKDEKFEQIEIKIKELDKSIKNNTQIESTYKKATTELKKFEVKEQKTKDKKIELKNKIKLLEKDISNNTKQANLLRDEIKTLQESITKLQSNFLEIKSNISKLLNDKTLVQFKKELDDEATKLNKVQETLAKLVNKTSEKITINRTTIEGFAENIVELNQKIKIIEDEIIIFLIEKGFKDREEILSIYIKDDDKIKQLIDTKEAIKNRSIEIETLLNSVNESLGNELKKDITTTKPIEELVINAKELSDKRDEINKRAIVIQEQLKQNETIKKEQKNILKEIDTQKIVLAPWEMLNRLLGSAKGDKYQKFVQNLTLGHLLNLANRHLSYLSDRYKLIRTNSDKLDISIVDGYYIDKQRGVKTLSGGERFLVSLALALGLSDLVNDKIKVDSLFLDEGFGTLDENSLNMAINALEKLHAKGKLIGVISHVALLKERISAQIEIKKKSNGSSGVTIIC
ncbi:MAG: AAA family ATPase [Sulfurovum sp.]